MDSKTQFRRVLTSIADGRDALPSQRETELFRRALLAFGSETDDNQNCAASIGVSSVGKGKRRMTGLAVSRTRSLLSEILNSAESIRVPKQVRRQHPEITQREWAAVMRLAALVFVALERNADESRVG